MTLSRAGFSHRFSYLSFGALLLLLPPSRISAQSSQQPSASSPITMTECEGTNNCATWTLLGSQGNGKWPSGEEANLTVEKADAASVIIQRADSTGPSAGLTATYTGTRHGDRIGGDFTSSWPGHWENKAGSWYATVQHIPQGLPAVMRFCGPVHCATLTWNGGHYDARFDDLNPNGGPPSTYTVELFKPEGVLIHRKDPGGLELDMTGRMSPQGNSIVDGKMSNGTNYQLTWGTALNTARIPGQPQQNNPVLVVRPALVCFPWFFGITCD